MELNKLKQTINELQNRADDNIAIDKANAYQQGITEIKQNYGNTYTQDALQTLLNEYEEKTYSQHMKELEAFEEQSEKIKEQALKEINKLESDYRSATDPQTEEELTKQNYIINKVNNELSLTFTTPTPRIDELDELINQAKHNKLYANALLQSHNQLIKNIQTNERIDDTEAQTLKYQLSNKMAEVKAANTPKGFEGFEALKELYENNQGASTFKRNLYQIMLEQKNLA